MTMRVPGINGGKDERTGIVNVTVSHFVSTQEEIMTVGDASFWGVPLVSRNFGNWESDSDEIGFQVDLKYEGKSPDDIPGPDGAEQESWSFDSSFREIPIEQHPYLPSLLKKYGGRIEDGKVVWPWAPEKKNGSVGLSETASEEEGNPAFGRNTVLMFFSVATREYWTSNLDGAFADMGKIYSILPGRGPKINFEHGQNWIKRAPKPQTSGDGWLVREDYWLSGPGGWKEGVDSLIFK